MALPLRPRDVADVLITHSVFQGFFENKHATFQQYTLVPPEFTAKVRTRVTAGNCPGNSQTDTHVLEDPR